MAQTLESKLPWEAVVKSKRATQLKAIAPYLEQGILPIDYFTDINEVEELSKLLQNRRLSAEEVILAYIKRSRTSGYFSNSSNGSPTNSSFHPEPLQPINS